MAGADCSVGSLFDLMLREQFIQSCSPEVAMFVKERKPSTIAEVTSLAEQYVEAHGSRINSRTTSYTQREATEPEPYAERYRQEPQRRRDRPANLDRSKTCFICGRQGHFARDCYSKQTTNNEKRIGAVCTYSEVKDGSLTDNEIDRRLKLENGESLSIISGVCTMEGLEGTNKLDIQKGLIGTKAIKVLRDTGCELAAVRKELVKKEQFLGKQITMITIDGEAKVVPTATITVDTPYYVGIMDVMVPKALTCDLVIGNIAGATDKPDPNWRSSVMKRTDKTSVSGDKADDDAEADGEAVAGDEGADDGKEACDEEADDGEADYREEGDREAGDREEADEGKAADGQACDEETGYEKAGEEEEACDEEADEGEAGDEEADGGVAGDEEADGGVTGDEEANDEEAGDEEADDEEADEEAADKGEASYEGEASDGKAGDEEAADEGEADDEGDASDEEADGREEADEGDREDGEREADGGERVDGGDRAEDEAACGNKVKQRDRTGCQEADHRSKIWRRGIDEQFIFDSDLQFRCLQRH